MYIPDHCKIGCDGMSLKQGKKLLGEILFIHLLLIITINYS